MLCIFSSNNDVFFNLASEEYFLKNISDDLIIIWKSTPSVIVGKHQNTFAEVNHKYLRDKNILVARRLTGGGAVFHDEGNLNFTFIKNGEEGKLVDFKKFISPVVEFLESLKLPAKIGLKNDVRIDNLKISGNAEHVYRSRVLHHGTLLFNTNIEKLSKALQVYPNRYIDKSVQSNRSEVANISDYLTEKISIDEFAERLFNFLIDKHKGTTVHKIEGIEAKAILKLRDEKYHTWEWIYGYSPPFSIERKITINNNDCLIKIKVAKGRIIEANIYGSDSGDHQIKIIDNMKGLRFEYSEIVNYLEISRLNDATKKLLPEILF